MKAKPNTSPTPPTGGKRKVVVPMDKLKPLTSDEHRRMREAARDPKLSAGRKFPSIKD